jgi:SAM-dependent methyltransferase
MTQLNFFSEGSPFLRHPLLTPERTALEVSFILSQINLPLGSRILDIGCGPGRHTIELASRGYEVLGIDPSAAMIEAARARAVEAGISPEFRQIGGELFATQDAFDATICLFTTLGQISERGANSALLGRAFEALRRGGLFVVEVPQRDWVIAHLKTEERFSEGENYTNVTRRLDLDERAVTERFDVVSPNGTQTYLLRYRLYDQVELVELLRQSGFSILNSFGDYEGNPLGPDSPIMLVFARK